MFWTLAGLGNPGSAYTMTRHNIGFLVVEEFAKALRLSWNKDRDVRYAGPFIMGEGRVYLVEPMTFMNLSGQAIAPFLLSKGLPVAGLIVVHDDLDLPFGEIRFRFGGGTAGHKGLESIVRNLQTAEFYRVRVGIGKPEEKGAVVHYVLEPFRSSELSKLPELIQYVHIGLRQLIEEGLAKAQESFHRRVLVE